MSFNLKDYPQHEKLDAIPLAERDAIGGFVEWLHSQGFTICHWRDAGNNGEPRMVPATEAAIAEVLAEGGSWARIRARRLQEKGMENPLFETWGEGFYPEAGGPEHWLARYYGIDRAALAREKDAMLAAVRAGQM